MVEPTANYRMMMENYDVDDLVNVAGWLRHVQGTLEVPPFTRKSKTVKQGTVTWDEIREVAGEEWERRVYEAGVRYGYGLEPPSV